MLAATDLLGEDQIGLGQDPEVLHDPETGHRRQDLAQLGQRLAVPLEQGVHQPAAAGIGQGHEDRVVPGR